MAKGQLRSGREAKKPKKSTAAKQRPAGGSGFVEAALVQKSAKKG
jgi:hypothetical protein